MLPAVLLLRSRHLQVYVHTGPASGSENGFYSENMVELHEACIRTYGRNRHDAPNSDWTYSCTIQYNFEYKNQTEDALGVIDPGVSLFNKINAIGSMGLGYLIGKIA